MTHHFNIELLQHKITLKVTYRNNKFLRLELVRGKLSNEQLKAIGNIIPPTEDDFAEFNKKYEGRINYEIVTKDKSLYQKMTDEWFTFYEALNGFKPKFTGIDGKHLNQIIAYFRKQATNDDEVLATWQALLDNWKLLDKFHQDNTDLKYINSRLNVILNAIKQKNETNTTSSGKTVGL